MRAFVNTPDGPELRDVDLPSPRPADAVIDVEAFSLNRGELSLLAARTDGWRPGQDVAGIVSRAAADGSGPPEGSPVVGLVHGGGWADRVAVPTASLAVRPDGVTAVDAAALPIAGVTALRTLRLGGSVLGARVLVAGASGAVGRMQVELAALSGATVTAVARAERAAELRELGAAEVVAAVDDAEPGFPLVLEQLGGPALEAAIGRVAPAGTVVFIGATSGEPAPVDLAAFIGHENARLQSYLSYVGDPVGTDLTVLMDLLRTGRLHTTVTRVADRTELPAVLADLRNRRISGKAVLTTAALTT